MLAYLPSATSIPRQAGALGSHFIIQYMAKLGSWEPNSGFRSSVTDQPPSCREGMEEIENESFDTVPVWLPHFPSHCRTGYKQELYLVRQTEIRLQIL